jgi:hypothetical protein
VALLLSLYVLLALCLRLPALFRTAKGWLLPRLHRFDAAALWVRITLLSGLLLNLFYAIFRTVMGLITNSLWFLAESVYYMGLSAARFWVVETDRADQHIFSASAYVRGGKLLLILSISAIGTVTMAVAERGALTYPLPAVWGAALFAAWRLVSALLHLFRSHRRKQAFPLLTKSISLSAAAVSLFGFQTTLLARIGAAPRTRMIWNISGGAFVCISLPIMALFLFFNGKRMQKGR